MKLQDIFRCLIPLILGLLVITLEHEKSFLLQDGASIVWSLAIYEDSLLLTASNDIVQKNVQTGAIQRTFRAHQKAIFSLVVTTDSRMISAANDDMIILWDLETGSMLKRIWLRSSDTLIKSLYLQDDQVFVGGLDSKLRQVDLVTGRVVRTISLVGGVYGVAAKEDSLFVGMNSPPYVLKLSIESGTIIQSFDGHSGPIFSLVLYDGMLFSGSFDTTIICWNTANGEIIRSFVGHSGSVHAVAVFNGELYSTASGVELFKWSLNNGLITKKFPLIHLSIISSLAYKSQFLYTGSYDTAVIKWDASSGDVLFAYTGKNSKLRSVVSWKNLLISGGEDAEIRIWDAATDNIEPFAVIDNNFAMINVLYLFEGYVYSGDNFGDVKVIDISSLTLVRVIKVPGDAMFTFAASKLSFYGAGFTGSIYQWNVSSGIQIASFNAHSDQIMSLMLANDVLCSGSYDSTVKTWNTQSLENVGAFSAMAQLYAILIEQELLIACTASTVEMFSFITGEKNVLLREPSACFCIISRGSFVFTGHEDSLIRVRNSDSLVSIQTYAGHLNAVHALCFDEVFSLYSAGFDGTIKRWSMASRSVAFSFESKNGSVSALTVHRNQLFVGLKSGSIVCYDTINAMALNYLNHHTKEVSSLGVFNGSVYSSSFDGSILNFPPTGDGNFTSVYKSDRVPLKDLAVSGFFWLGLQGDTKIVLISTKSNSTLVKAIDFQMPVACVAATDSVILAGSKSGIIYAWDSKTLQLAFEMKGHVSPVNDLLIVDDSLFSASDDKTIVEWSLERKTSIKTYERLSASALGHLGPVNSLSYCSGTLFSAGSDLTVRRWNTNIGKHDDVYFGFRKSVTTVLCYNGSVFAGSEDFSVLMFKPSLPQSQDETVMITTTVAQKSTKQRSILKVKKVSEITLNILQVLVSVSIVLVLIIPAVYGYVFIKKRSKTALSEGHSTTTRQSTDYSFTATDLKTVVNSVMGISKHAAFLLESSTVAKVKKLAAGGGGELYLANLMDPSLRKKHGETVVQKIVFIKNKVSEEAFYQEVGIMILLSAFPNFCKIIGYTENPLSMIMKHYPQGSLYDWCRKTSYNTKLIVKILRETAFALHIMHSHYLAHCDIKTQNILIELVNELPVCFLTDFGITQILSDKIIAAKAFNVMNLRGLSTNYAAPEAFRNFKAKKYISVDFKVYDIYSYGCLIYEMLSRRAPWK